MREGRGRSSEGRGGRGGDKKDDKKRTLFRRRKVCKFCADKIDDINYKDVKLLGPFVPERGKILPRRISGTCATHQRKLQTAIKRARQLALIPYVTGRLGALATRTVKSTMEVILRDHVENVGKRGEVVKVADGYARNYLLPRKLALLATPGNLKQVERERVKLDAKEAEEQGAAQNIATKMEGLEVVITRKVGETEALYGSVTSADIAEALAKKGFDIDKRKIGLREPIKKLGSADRAGEAASRSDRPDAGQSCRRRQT